MLTLSALRWGKPYKSLEAQEVVHFDTGEPIAKIGNVNGGMLQLDMKHAPRARAVLREIPPSELLQRCKKAAELFETGELPVGDGIQSVDDFIHQQSASTGLPEHMCRSNMKKNSFVLANMEQILACLTRGLDLSIFTKGYGDEGRGVTVSYQCQSPVLGAVLPNNSPGSTHFGYRQFHFRWDFSSSLAARSPGHPTGWLLPLWRQEFPAKRLPCIRAVTMLARRCLPAANVR